MVKLISALATCIAAASATMMEQMAQSSYWQGGNLMASGSASISLSVGITIVAVNNGGGSKWQQVNNYQGKMGKTIEVTVGGTAGLVYSPSTINAEIGDIVQFNFMSKNHTVTQSTFPVPCKKMDGGMDSGFMPNMMDGTPPPAFKMQVMKKDPLCKHISDPSSSRGSY
jgi:plastocyanin